MIFSQIVAQAKNGVIGYKNQLLWHYKEDLQYFKSLTKNKIMIMGRKTFDSLQKPLPYRVHIVISRSNQTEISDPKNPVFYVHSIEEAFNKCKDLINQSSLKIDFELNTEEIMIIGGGEIYKQALPYCQKLFITEIDLNFEGDTYYPQNYKLNFQKISSQKSQSHNEITYEVWQKI